MVRQTVREIQPARPNLHRLSQPVRYHSLHNLAAASAIPLGAEARLRLPQPLRHAVPNRQREFLAGRLCAAQALRCLGADSTHVGMAGDRAPVWPDGVVGSITHSGGFAAAAVAWAATSPGLASIPNRSSPPRR